MKDISADYCSKIKNETVILFSSVFYYYYYIFIFVVRKKHLVYLAIHTEYEILNLYVTWWKVDRIILKGGMMIRNEGKLLK